MNSLRPGLLFLVFLPLLGCRGSEEQPPIVTPERPKDAGRDTRGSSGSGGSGGSAGTAGTSGTGGSSVTPGTGGNGSGGTGGSPTPVDPSVMSDAAADATVASDTQAPDTAPASDAATEGGSTGGPNMEATWSYTACDKRAIMFPKIDKNNGVFPIGSCPPPLDLYRECGNNSKLKVMKATSLTHETGYVHPPEYAIDEYILTRWSSHSMPMSWLKLEFATEVSFKRLYLAWELAHATDYDIVVSNDDMTWTTLKQVRGGDGFQDIVDVEGKAKYIRINGINRGRPAGQGGPYGYSLFDVTICGDRP